MYLLQTLNIFSQRNFIPCTTPQLSRLRNWLGLLIDLNDDSRGKRGFIQLFFQPHPCVGLCVFLLLSRVLFLSPLTLFHKSSRRNRYVELKKEFDLFQSHVRRISRKQTDIPLPEKKKISGAQFQDILVLACKVKFGIKTIRRYRSVQLELHSGIPHCLGA